MAGPAIRARMADPAIQACHRMHVVADGDVVLRVTVCCSGPQGRRRLRGSRGCPPCDQPVDCTCRCGSLLLPLLCCAGARACVGRAASWLVRKRQGSFVCACGGHAKMEMQPPRGCSGVSKSILHTKASYYTSDQSFYDTSPAYGARRTHLGAGWQQVGAGELGCTHGWSILWGLTGTVSYPLRAVVWGCLAGRGSHPPPHVCTQRSQDSQPHCLAST